MVLLDGIGPIGSDGYGRMRRRLGRRLGSARLVGSASARLRRLGCAIGTIDRMVSGDNSLLPAQSVA